jgi:hypothetical protein
MTEFVQFDKHFLSEYDLKLNKFDQKLFHHIEVFQSLSHVSLLIYNNGLLVSYPRLAERAPTTLAKARGG